MAARSLASGTKSGLAVKVTCASYPFSGFECERDKNWIRGNLSACYAGQAAILPGRVKRPTKFDGKVVDKGTDSEHPSGSSGQIRSNQQY